MSFHQACLPLGKDMTRSLRVQTPRKVSRRDSTIAGGPSPHLGLIMLLKLTTKAAIKLSFPSLKLSLIFAAFLQQRIRKALKLQQRSSMASQPELPFRQRLIDSAVGLAQSTATNTPGVLQDELSSLRTFQKPGLQTRRRGNSISSYQNSGVRRPSSSKHKSPEGSAESSFRSQGGVDPSSDQLASDFDSFYNTAPEGVSENPRMPLLKNDFPSKEHLTSFPRNESQIASGLDLSETGQDLGKTNEQLETTDTLLSSQNATSSFRANARLNQLLQHLGPAEVAVRETARLGERPTALQHMHQHASIRQSHMEHHALHPVDQEPIIRHEMHDDPDQANEEEEEQFDQTFHCPYVQCHQNLLAERLAMGRARRVRGCVHAGCEYSAQGTEEWMRHILLPHHDLQPLVQ